MTGIGIPPVTPPITPGTATDGSVWAGVVAAIVLAAILVVTVWVYVRSRPVRRDVEEPGVVHTHLPKAA
ncbi:MAG TPA: hypothetical protein VF028_05590 [Actinomycetota bacterium]|jgi:uncharacterized membrane protein|nr:hypothetical protein [Actinomycetota bacterium]